MGEERKVCKVSEESKKEKDHLEDRGVDVRMESKWILGRLAERRWSGFSWHRIRTGGGLL
jgi:hypothetical protein